MTARTASGTRYRMVSARRRAAADQGGRHVHPRHRHVHRGVRRVVRKRLALARHHRQGGDARDLVRLAPARQVGQVVGAGEEEELRLRAAAPRTSRSVSTVYEGPCAPQLQVVRREARVAGDGGRAPSPAAAAAGVRTRPPLSGCTAAGIHSSRSSRSTSHASEAATRCPRCGGSNVPPNSPSRTDRAVSALPNRPGRLPGCVPRGSAR